MRIHLHYLTGIDPKSKVTLCRAMRFWHSLWVLAFHGLVFPWHGWAQDSLIFPSEHYFRNARMLTRGGDNAEAYWNNASNSLIFQSNNPAWGLACDQIFVLDSTHLGINLFNDSKSEQTADNRRIRTSQNPVMVSTGKGRTTCAYFVPGDQRVVWASTHAVQDSCPPPPAPRPDRKYLWSIDAAYDIYLSDLQGGQLETLVMAPGYDAEATFSPDGRWMVFTSTRDGDLDLYLMSWPDRKITRVTKEPGYDGGAFFSPDSKQLIFRASRPQTPEELAEYRQLLSEGLVAPTRMELFTCYLDGTGLRQITSLGGANWAPYFHPDGRRIIFSSNHHSKRGFPFNLFMVNLDGTGLEQITFDRTFDSFPMFSPDGRRLVFASNRCNGGTRDTNLILVDWVELP
jgi:dipeptidyl aminopeptidase/acylaminoacyl peptidase